MTGARRVLFVEQPSSLAAALANALDDMPLDLLIDRERLGELQRRGAQLAPHITLHVGTLRRLLCDLTPRNLDSLRARTEQLVLLTGGRPIHHKREVCEVLEVFAVNHAVNQALQRVTSVEIGALGHASLAAREAAPEPTCVRGDNFFAWLEALVPHFVPAPLSVLRFAPPASPQVLKRTRGGDFRVGAWLRERAQDSLLGELWPTPDVLPRPIALTEEAILRASVAVIRDRVSVSRTLNIMPGGPAPRATLTPEACERAVAHGWLAQRHAAGAVAQALLANLDVALPTQEAMLRCIEETLARQTTH